jgi:hypothetical protein
MSSRSNSSHDHSSKQNAPVSRLSVWMVVSFFVILFGLCGYFMYLMVSHEDDYRNERIHVKAASTAPAYTTLSEATSVSGAVLDGVTLEDKDIILLQHETTKPNGLYRIDYTPENKFVLNPVSSWHDRLVEQTGNIIFVKNGTVNKNRLFVYLTDSFAEIPTTGTITLSETPE